ncbi:phosphatase PAP2 family protein [Rhodococcus sp. HNM0569]|uniref:acid phosphatase n=1 Tax=Rhodococcus sp. HNM0569 TaxID=2716340 RepID=UPI00146B45D2|nr:phosphatase PAP2 family protein [Rhodococcus sp. HNM0569]NLU82611.1 phosphatase PAP2 family protein [Rhodococcus sp. HNM0569]
MSVRRGMAVLAVAGAMTVGLTAPVAFAQPPAPAPFELGELVGPYPSDLPARGTYIGVLDGFTALRDSRPDIMDRNLEHTVAINNSADEATQAQALYDDNHARLDSLADAFGERLASVFREALADGRLPKVESLLDGYLARAGLLANSTLVEKQYWSNPRPFDVAPERIVRYHGDGVSGGADPYGDTAGTGSYPSGHTSQGYWTALLLADMLPEFAPQLLTRASAIGHSRVVLGVHYPLDVMGGRIMGQAAAVDRLADPAFARLVDAAGVELRGLLEAETGGPLADSAASTDAELYRDRLTYGFERSNPDLVNDIPPSAAVLLRHAAPDLTDAERLDVLRETAIDAGYPLDVAGPDGGWLRIDLVAAYEELAARG